MSSHDYVELTVAEVIRETEDAVSLVFDVPDRLASDFAYQPGQFLTLRLPVGGKYRHRCYSLSSAPEIDKRHKVTVKRIDGGLVSTELCEHLTSGMTLLVQPPAGHFTPANLDQDLALFAGGSGITPVMSIVKAALARGTGQLRVFYANRDEKSVIFAREFADLVQAHPDRLTVIHWLQTVQGLPHAPGIAATVSAWADMECFMCGPEPFMNAVNDALKSLGVTSQNIHLERFVSLPDEDEVAESEAAAVAASVDAELTISLDGDTHVLAWPADKNMLEVMLAAGVDAPYSCRVGGCSACMCKLMSGDVVMGKNLVLDDQDLAEGWVLACQSHPRSSAIAIEIP